MRLISFIAFVCILGLVFSLNVLAVTASEIEALIKQANKGDMESQVKLNHLYHGGTGVQLDYKRAAYWAEKAANQGHLDSQYILGVYYDSGIGVEQSDIQSAVWFKKAAERGHIEAQTRIGMAYQYGIGVKANETLSIEWYEKAAKKNDYYAQSLIVIAFEESSDKNFTRYDYWVRTVAKNKHVDAMFMLSNYYYELGNKFGYENSYLWAYLMKQNGADVGKLLKKLEKHLDASTIERAISKAVTISK